MIKSQKFAKTSYCVQAPKVYISVRVVLQKWKNLSKLQIAALMHTHPA